MNRRGMVYSFIAILLVIILVLMFAGKVDRFSDRSYAVSRSAKSMDATYLSLIEDIERGIYIVGFRTLVVMNNELLDSGEYFTDAEASFIEIFNEGKYEGVPVGIMENTTFEDFKIEIEEIFAKQGISVSITQNSIRLIQSSPWHVTPVINVSIELLGPAGMFSWNDDVIISNDIPIIELSDPLYVIETEGFVVQQIKPQRSQTLTLPFIEPDDLKQHIISGYYLASASSPSYLMRLEGDILNPSEQGIQSLVDLDRLRSQGLDIGNYSIVDYKYFNGTAAPLVSGITDVRLDSPDKEVYVGWV